MKLVFIASSIFFISSIVRAQTDITDKGELFKKLLTVLSKKDTSAFFKLYPNYEGFKKLSGLTEENIKRMSEEDKRLLKDTLTPAQFKEVYESRLRDDFRRILDSADKFQIDWNTITITGLEEMRDYTPEPGYADYFNGKLFLKTKNKAYTLHFHNLIWLYADKCWYAPDLIALSQK